MREVSKIALYAGAGLIALGVATAQAETTLVIVSWGGAYTASQQQAYHEPYMKLNPDNKLLNDDFRPCSRAQAREIGVVSLEPPVVGDLLSQALTSSRHYRHAGARSAIAGGRTVAAREIESANRTPTDTIDGHRSQCPLSAVLRPVYIQLRTTNLNAPLVSS